METKECSCAWCKTTSRAFTIGKKLRPEDAAWIFEQLEEIERLGTELAWYKAKEAGTCPE